MTINKLQPHPGIPGMLMSSGSVRTDDIAQYNRHNFTSSMSMTTGGVITHRSNRHYRGLVNHLNLVIEERRAAIASPHSVELAYSTFDAEKVADFIVGNPLCSVHVDEEADKIMLVCPDAATASLAVLSL